MKIVSIAFSLVFLLSSSPVFACMHAKNGENVEQTEFHVALAHAKGKQTIVIKPKIRSSGTEVGWVFLVPNVPTKMRVAKNGVLTSLAKYYFPRNLRSGKTKGTLKGLGGKKIEVSKTVKTGPFTITPIKGGYEGISKWLKKHDFSHIPEGHIKPYLDKDWVVLAAKIKISDSQIKLARQTVEKQVREQDKEERNRIITKETRIELDAKLEAKLAYELQNPKIDIPPLIIQFRSKKIVFPWLFERTNTEAEFRFLVFTANKIREKTLQKFREIHDEDQIFYESFPSDYRPRAKLKPMPKNVKKILNTFGFRKHQKINVVRIHAGAMSHDEAVKKGIPDIEFAVPIFRKEPVKKPAERKKRKKPRRITPVLEYSPL